MLNLLLIGYGKMGRIHAKSIIGSRSAKLCGIVDPNLDKELRYIDNVKIYNDLGEVKLDKKIDGVVVSSTTHSHYSIAQKLLDYKIPILIEKPLSTKLEEVNYITRECLKKNIVLQVGFVEIYNPVVNYLTNEKIKNIKKVEIFRFSEPVDESRNLENVMYDLAIHDISVFEYLFKLSNINILNSNTEIHNNKISKATVNFLSNNINVILKVSNRAKSKKRMWKITTDDSLYEINFLKKNILINNKKNNSQLIEFQEGLSSIDSQLNSFVKKIENTVIDREHLKNINKTHEFISLIN